MRPFRIFLSLLAVVLLTTSPVVAGAYSASVDGFVGPGDPSMLVALILTPNCTGGYGAVNVFYDFYPVSVTATGLYHVEVLSSTGNTAFYFYQDNFDPAAAADNCIAASNSGNPQMVDVALTPGTQYYVAIIDDTFAQLGDTYTLSIDGPGQIFLGYQPTIQAIPTLSTWSLVALGVALALLALVLLRRRAFA